MESHINLEQLFQLAILEDLGPAGIKGDITSKAIAEDMVGKARIIAKMDCCISGLMVAKDFYRFLDPGIEFKLSKPDGSIAKPGEELAMVSGPLRYLLAGERIALNFIMHLSGIATYTNRFVEAIKAYPGYILDTRKTTPGLRLLEKEAVMHGKGKNHRLGLFDAVLIKDNHRELFGSIPAAVSKMREINPPLTAVEVEVESFAELEEAIAAGADMIMLDNMDIQPMREAVELCRQKDDSIKIEASGGVTLDTVEKIAATGVDYISIGAITHSAPAVDISMEVVSTKAT